jgi:hypothetical protein
MERGNSGKPGTMQLWRMKPDRSGGEQLTFDEYNNWFPHVSPDNKWIVFISFSADIDAVSHPSYKRVMLRLMPVGGGDCLPVRGGRARLTPIHGRPTVNILRLFLILITT